jgi:hypothetical protein
MISSLVTESISAHPVSDLPSGTPAPSLLRYRFRFRFYAGRYILGPVEAPSSITPQSRYVRVLCHDSVLVRLAAHWHWRFFIYMLWNSPPKSKRSVLSLLFADFDSAAIHSTTVQRSMAITSTMASLLEDMRTGWNEVSAKPLPFVVMVMALMAVSLSVRFLSRSSIPHLNPRAPLEFTDARSKQQFISGARGMLAKWFASNPNKPVRVIADYGEVTVLPPDMANEIRNDERLSFSSWVFDAFHAHLPGFEGFREGSRESHILQSVTLRDLTKQLSKYPIKNTEVGLEITLPRQSHRASDGGDHPGSLR